MEYYLAIKRNKVLMYTITWMNFKNIMLSERSQTRKATYCIIPLIEMSRVGKSIDLETRLVVARGWGEREMTVIGMGFLHGVMKMFWNYW